MGTFTDELSDALISSRRKAQLAGRSLQSSELSAITSGVADQATEQLNEAKSLEISEDTLAESVRANQAAEELSAEQLAETTRANLSTEEQTKAAMEQEGRLAEEAMTLEKSLSEASLKQEQEQHAAELAQESQQFAEQMEFEEWAAELEYEVAMDANDSSGGGSHICTAVKDTFDDWDYDGVLQAFKKYALKKHKDLTLYYLRYGMKIISGIKASRLPLWNVLEKRMIRPVVELFKRGEKERAYVLYRELGVALVRRFAPELDTEEANRIYDADKENKNVVT